uniref:Uncharacterized protein n=1 Tax=Brassica oleracea TaxID=3712 RepID=A0A3P6ACW8_BRAOL|nr:unnamed protein product [Brassica oleracea]
MHRQPDLIPATPPPPGRVTTGRETSSPLRSRASPMQSPQEARPSENPDSSSSFKACLSPTTGNLAFVRPNLHDSFTSFTHYWIHIVHLFYMAPGSSTLIVNFVAL